MPTADPATLDRLSVDLGRPKRAKRARPILGSTTPRLWTPPLRRLTPATSVGFRQIEWARDTLRRPLDPWEEFAVIHAGELRRDGRLRFRMVFVIVARQNGKTEICVVLGAYWLLEDTPGLTLGTSTKLDYARESFNKIRRHVERSREPEIMSKLPGGRWYREANGEQELWSRARGELEEEARYKIAASNPEGGRSLTVRRLVLDELRQHHDHSAWDASVPATIAVPDAQVWALSNAGTDLSVVLNEARDEHVELGPDGVERIVNDRDTDTCWLEWSAPPGADPEDPAALALANPNFNRPGRIDGAALVKMARSAKRAGGRKLNGFRTEHMCQRVRALDPAIDADAWARGAVPGSLAGVRRRVALVVDVSPDMQHATLYAAGPTPDGRYRVDHVADWSGPGAVEDARRMVPAHVAKVRPARFGWFPQGPGASLAGDLRKGRAWPPAGVELEEITGDTPAVCMGYAASVLADQIVHGDDPLLNDQTAHADRLQIGDRWVFARRGAGHVDAVYAASGAVHLARNLPPPPDDGDIILPD